MKTFASFCMMVLLSVSSIGYGADIVVNSTDSTTTPPAGQTNLWLAISLLQDGDTIKFSIAGAGPHYLETPPGGYPLITKHNVTIDGYSQSGAVPNTNPILAANNAQIKIVLTSTNDNFTSMDYNNSTNNQAGFGPGDFALLGIYGATNVQIRGLCLLGGSVGGLSSHFAIAMARDSTHATMGVHVNGCWIGVAPDGTTVKDFDDAIHASSARYEASYTFRGTNAGCGFTNTFVNRNPGVWESDRELWNIFRATNTCPELPLPVQPTINASSARYVHFNHVIGVKAGSLNPRAEFNVIVGGTIPIIMEGYGFRVSGNFLGVLPDGVTQYLVPLAQPGRFAESFIEIGRGVSDVVIGTDGDGVNDADERNVIGGVVTDGGGGSINRNGYRHCVEFYSQSGALNASGVTGDDRQRIRVSGNYIGIGVDGTTRFTNGVSLLNGSSAAGTHFLVGSDFDGVSDAIEGNVFYGNYPAGYYYLTAYTNSTRSGSGSHGFFDEPEPNAGGFSTRGNKIVNNYPYPFNPQRNNSFANITTYVNKALAVAQPATAAGFEALKPVISASSTTARLIGTAPANNATYPYLLIDVYLPDPEGLTNGLVVPDPFLTNGWIHGKTYLGSFVDNSGLDADPAVGAFDFSICNLGLSAGTQVTISANYSKDAPGTHNARVLTSLFSNPQTLGAANCFVVSSGASSGPGSLNAALASLVDNSYVTFNIPGAGPHYITGPVGGFGVITKNGVTIDGYTQPGSSVNTSTILGSNNAVIKIVIRGTDTRTGPDATTVTNGSVAGFTDLTALAIPGFTDSESALLAFDGASDITVRGLCFLGDWAALPNGDDNPPGPASPSMPLCLVEMGHPLIAMSAAVGLAWDPDNVTVGRLKDGVAWFGAGVDNLTIGVAAGPANAAAARAQFNIFMGMYIALIGDLGPVRISGNFFNVYPDGLHDYNVSNRDGDVDHSLEAFFEQAASGSSILIGTDGDGVNDAEERNIFGGVTDCGDRRILEWYGGAPSKYVIAGNYFGVGVDGVTRFTNGGPRMEIVETFKFGPAQFGSDFNGVSDALEGNVISWNYPFATLYPDPSDPTAKTTYDKFRFANIDAGSVLAVRGNSFIGMESPPITYFGRPSDDAGRLTTYSNRVAQFMAPTGDYDTFYPQLSASSSSTHLIGSCAPGFNGYDQAIVIDVYKADPEGWVNGMKFAFTNLIVGGVTNGFPQGKTYVGSLRDNGPYDLNAAVGGFDFDLGAAGLVLTSSDFVTVTANYFDTALTGTAVGATDVAPHTSNFSHPIGLGPIVIGSATLGGGGTTLTINWTGGAPPYTLQKKSPITGGWSTVQTGIIGPPATVTISGSEGYYRVGGN